MIIFEQFWNILWFLPLLVFWWHFGKKRKAIFLLFVFILGVFILMKPMLRWKSKESMLVIVVDKSLSIKEAQYEIGQRNIRKLLDTGMNHRMAIVAFGKNVIVEKWFEDYHISEDMKIGLDPESSSLNDAIAMAVAILPLDQPGKILLMSDADYRGVSPLLATLEAKRRGIPIDIIRLDMEESVDVGVSDIHLPVRVASNEIFSFQVDVFANKETKASYELRRKDHIIAKGEVGLKSGETSLSFIDQVPLAGNHEYEFQIFAKDDLVSQNNLGKNLLQVDGTERVLVINLSGKKDNFSRALEGSGKIIDVFASTNVEVNLSFLTPYQLIVLENIPADHFSEGELRAMRIAVENYGKNLIMTGGRSSFGMGGYLHSPLEDILPIDMMPKNEKRKINIGICMMLDRSGSMGMVVSAGQSKMDLANLGVVSTLDLLGRQDEVAILAVDTSVHHTVEMTPLKDKAEIRRRVLSIEAGGGGIYTYNALYDGAKQINKSQAGVRHMILFADAADAEQPEDSVELCKKLFENGVTTSVVALGDESNQDAEFLKSVAKAGNGRIFFTEDAVSLPRLFTQDIMEVKRDSFLQEEIAATVGSDIEMFGAISTVNLPALGGCNLNYHKENTQVYFISENTYHSPLITSWQVKSGKVMAVSFEVDGPYTGPFAQWEKYDTFFANLCKFMIPPEKNSDIRLDVTRQGHQVLLNVAVDPQQALKNQLIVQVFSGHQLDQHLEVPLQKIDEGEYQGYYSIENASPHHHMIQYGAEIIKGNAVQLPYSSEYEMQRSFQERLALLETISFQTGGKKIHIVSKDLFSDMAPVVRVRSITLPCLFFLLLFILLDIIHKRLDVQAFSWLKELFRRKERPRKVLKTNEAESDETAEVSNTFDALDKIKKRRN